MILVEDFFNKLAPYLDKKYYPQVKYYHDNKNTQAIHYAVECFSNGVLTYRKFITKLARSCKEDKYTIHEIVKKYVKDFDGFIYKP